MEEREHEQYLENIRVFLTSDTPKTYSTENFIKTFEEAVGAND